MYPGTPSVSSPDIPIMIQQLKSVSLSPSQMDIVYSFETFYGKKGCLTERQYQLLQKFAAEHSQEKQEEHAVWRNNFTQEMRDKLNIVCEYYSKTGYFQSIVSQWQSDKENYIPTKQQYEKISGNTYAKKLLESHTLPTVFNNGDLVCIRANITKSSIRYLSKRPEVPYSSTILFVVDNRVFSGSAIHRYCKVFPLNNPEALMLVREKDLKTYRKGK